MKRFLTLCLIMFAVLSGCGRGSGKDSLELSVDTQWPEGL